jgi:hypothetical protein
MIVEIERGDFTHVFADETNETWEYIQQATALEDMRYANLKVGPEEKYTMCNVLCYKGEPIQFFTMNGRDFGEGVLRGYTSQYTLTKFRHFEMQNKKFPAARETVNFYENVWPLVESSFPQYKMFFYSSRYGESNLEVFFKTMLINPDKWSWPTDRLYRIGRMESKASAWKYVSHMGDISLLNRPSITTEEYISRFRNTA